MSKKTISINPDFFKAFSTISMALSTPAQNPLGEAKSIFNSLDIN